MSLTIPNSAILPISDVAALNTTSVILKNFSRTDILAINNEPLIFIRSMPFVMRRKFISLETNPLSPFLTNNPLFFVKRLIDAIRLYIPTRASAFPITITILSMLSRPSFSNENPSTSLSLINSSKKFRSSGISKSNSAQSFVLPSYAEYAVRLASSLFKSFSANSF